MTVYAGPEKGQSFELKYSKEGSQRIVVGLQWNPSNSGWIKNNQRPHMLEHADEDILPETFVKNIFYYLYDTYKSFANIRCVHEHEKLHDLDHRDQKFAHFDLDLYCFVLDETGKFFDLVGPESSNLIDKSEKIYHSGENFSGQGGLDDEQIFIELANIPDNYKNIIFVVTSDCKFSLDEIDDPYIHIADSLTGQDLLKSSIKAPIGQKAYAYVCANMYKKDNNWHLKNIDTFADFSDDKNFIDQWQQYIENFFV